MLFASEIPLALWLLTGCFSLIASVLAASTLTNVWRLRNVRMSWKAGRMRGYPLFATLFLGFTVLLFGAGLYQQTPSESILAGLYTLMAAGWFVTSYLASKRYITNNGIVKNVNDPSQTIAWHQIRDFVEQNTAMGTDFVFIYSEAADLGTDKLVRLELSVPQEKVADFKKLISHKLGRRITCYEAESIKVEQFD